MSDDGTGRAMVYVFSTAFLNKTVCVLWSVLCSPEQDDMRMRETAEANSITVRLDISTKPFLKSSIFRHEFKFQQTLQRALDRAATGEQILLQKFIRLVDADIVTTLW